MFDGTNLMRGTFIKQPKIACFPQSQMPYIRNTASKNDPAWRGVVAFVLPTFLLIIFNRKHRSGIYVFPVFFKLEVQVRTDRKSVV